MIRRFINKDKREVIELIKHHIPEYFDKSEEHDFKNYLENEIQDYFVFEDNLKIIGCGGINYFTKERIARISWDIIHPDFQGKGIGKKLLLYRIKHIKETGAADYIVVRTTQLVYKFYQTIGFKLEKIEKDYWAKGYDLYQLKMAINKAVY